MRFRLLLAATVLGAALLIPAAATPAAQTKLIGIVGPGFNITLNNESGQRVSQLDPGTYDIEVRDQSAEHNFHLFGPGNLNMRTEVEFVGTVTWSVTVTDGVYHYQCDPHAQQMNGSFRVGAAPPPPPPPPPKKKTPRLSAKVGPGNSISLRKASGGAFKTLKAGRYVVKVSDLSKRLNFHLFGTGVNRKTGVKFVGKATWTVTFKKGKRYRFKSDPRLPRLVRSFKAV